MEEENDIDVDYALKYFVGFQEKPDHVYFEHTYSQPGHKKYCTGYHIPAKYLFTNPVPNPLESNHNTEIVDIETIDHNPPLFFNSEKLKEQLIDKNDDAEYDENWAEKVDKKGWNIIKIRLFKAAVQILEADYFSRLAYKGLRDEAVKRHLMIKRSALRFKSVFGSVAWDPHSCQWLHSLLLEKLPACYLKVYSDAFQCLETKVPSHFLEHMTVSTSYMSVRSRLLGADSQNTNKKHWDLYSTALAQHKPKKIVGEPLLVLIPTNMGNNFTANSRPFRFVTDLSLLGTLITVSCPKDGNANTEIPAFLEQMIQATVSKIIELQSEHPDRPLILVGMGAGSLLACHIALGFQSKITAVVCVGFSIFTMEGKIGKANDKLLNLKTPLLFLIGQNSTTSIVDEIEEFRLRLRCKTGLVVIGGGDDNLRVNNFIKMRCAITQGIVDRCIINEISEFLNDILQPTNALLSILSNNDQIPVKSKGTVSSVDAQLLKKLLCETVNKLDSPLIQKLTKTLAAQLHQTDHEYGTTKTESSVHLKSQYKTSQRPSKLERNEKNNDSSLISESMSLKKILTSGEETVRRYTYLGSRSENNGNFSSELQYPSMSNCSYSEITQTNPFRSSVMSATFGRKRIRGGRRPVIRRTLPPLRNTIISTFSSVSNQSENTKSDFGNSSTIEDLTPDTLLDLPVVFADGNNAGNLIDDINLRPFQL